MIGTNVLRPGFVQLRVLELESALTHYRDRVGLTEVSRETDGRVYLKAYDEFDRHSIVLREADAPGMDFMGFKVINDVALSEYGVALRKRGLEVTEIDAGEQPGMGRRLAFVAPSGHRFDLYADIELSEYGPMVNNPDVWREDPRGMRAIRFDHCLLYGDEIDATKEIFMDVLGFRLSEIGYDPDGQKIINFLTCSNKAHDIAFVPYPEKNKFHHCAFLVEDWKDIGHAADLMSRYDVPVDIGPTRHGATRGYTIYFFDPSGNRNEVFAGGYTYYSDSPLRTWTGDELGKNIFYYEKELNERFLTVVT
jgi:catechol 2,3-dioxygenase